MKARPNSRYSAASLTNEPFALIDAKLPVTTVSFRR